MKPIFIKSVFIWGIMTVYNPAWGKLLKTENDTSHLQDQLNKSAFNYFIKNVGQYNDPSLLYSYKTKGCNTLFYNNRITYQFISFDRTEFAKVVENSGNYKSHKKICVDNVSLEFVNSLKKPTLNQIETVSSKANYFIGNKPEDWHSNVNNFKTLEYKNLYGGIDLKYYSTSGKLKYDLIVNPGANINDIQLQYSGVENIELNSNGELILTSPRIRLTEKIPVAYQLVNNSMHIVKVSYELKENNIVTFKCSDYDKSLPIIIDPALIYSTYLGGSNDDAFIVQSCVKDDLGNLYLIGTTYSSDFPTKPGSYNLNFNGGSTDAFVVKINTSGNSLIYSTYFGGSDYDFGSGIDINTQTGEIFLAGATWSSNFPLSSNAYQKVNASAGYGGDVYVAKLNNSGSGIIFSTLMGGPNDDQSGPITHDKSGNVYIGGQVGTGYPTTIGSYDTSHNGDYDSFATIVNNDGSSLIASTFIGSPLRDRGISIAIDTNLNVYVLTWVQGSFPVTSGAYDQIFNGGTYDVAVSKFNASLNNLIYSTYLGGSGDDNARINKCLKVDKKGQAYIAIGASNGYPTTPGAYDTSYNGGVSDVAVTKLNSTGSALIYSTFIGGPSDDIAHSIVINNIGEAYITGYCEIDFPFTKCAYDTTYNGGKDIFISKLDSSGSTLLYSTYFGGSNYERGGCIAQERDTVFVVGMTSSTDFPTTTGSFDQTYNGGIYDIFALKLSINSGTTTAAFSSSTNTCVGQQTTFVNNSSGGTAYTWNFGNGSSSNSVNPTHTYSSAGTYTVTLIVSGGCNVDSIKKTVTISPPPSANITGNTTICQGLSTTLTVSGGKTYSWSNGSTDSVLVVSPGSTTTYTVTTNIGSCASAAKTITVNVTPAPTATITGNTNICQGQSTTLTVSGGKTYSWSNGSTDSVLVVSPGSSTTYTVTTNNGSCTSATKTISVNVTAAPTANITGNTTICQGQSTTLTAGGGGTYQWSGGISSTSASVTVSPSSSTTYSVVINSGGCFSLPATVSVNVLMPPTATITGNTTVCQGQATTLTAGGGTSYQWSGGATSTSASIIVSPSSSTTYFLSTSNGSCSSPPTSVTVSVNPLPIADISGITTICQGQSTTLTAGGGISYQWSGGISSVSSSITVSPSTSTTYYVTTNDGTCTSSPASVTVIVTPIPTAGISGITTICSGQSTTLTASGGGNYQWYGGISSTSSAVTVSPSAITTYSVVVNDENCFSQPFSVTVQVLPVPNTTVAGDTTLCPGESITLTANGGSTYNWSSTSSVASSITVSPASTVTYTVIAGNGTCYGTSAIITVHVMPIPAASASPATSLIDHGASVNIVASGGSTYTWTPAIGLSCTNCSNPTATPDTSTIYTVTITDANGCTATAMVSILVKAFCSGNEKDIFIANIFSPNNDGKNDALKAQGNGLKDIYWAIFDRWGNKVFETTDLSKTWDGTYRGEMVVAGTYFYILKATCIQSNSEIDLKGNVTVIR